MPKPWNRFWDTPTCCGPIGWNLLEIVLIVTMGLTVALTVIYSGPLVALALGSLSP